ncbi:MAG: hypothetical protein JNL50_12750 [Phycisphaerae bacterium]|nr:hypothetical protein [Phycisphaerae bacterium]
MRRCVAGAVAIVFSSLAGVAPGQTASITGLGDLPGGPFRSEVYNISDDGQIVVGSSSVDDSFASHRAFRWTRAGGMQSLGKLSDNHGYSVAYGISGNGRWISGSSVSADGYDAFRWSAETGMEALGDVPGGMHSSGAGSFTNDGRICFGSGIYNDINSREAFRWTAETGLVPLGFAGGLGYKNSSLGSKTPDGRIAVGYSTTDRGSEAVMWTEETGYIPLGALDPNYWSSSAADITPDGRYIIGESYLEGKRTAFRWTQEAGMVPISPVGLGSARASPRSVTADGSIVVGWAQFRDDFAFIWTEAGGFERLDDYLLSHGLDLKALGWDLTDAHAITPDGRFIVVNGRNPNGDVEGAVIEIPSPSGASLFALGALAGLYRAPRRRR